jgi:uncharacterized membrane protein
VIEPRDFDAERRRILRRMDLLTRGLWGAAVLLAVAGGALLAWIFRGAGLPFLKTWVVASVLLLVIPAIVQVIGNRRRQRKRRQDGDGENSERAD